MDAQRRTDESEVLKALSGDIRELGPQPKLGLSSQIITLV